VANITKRSCRTVLFYWTFSCKTVIHVNPCLSELFQYEHHEVEANTVLVHRDECICIYRVWIWWMYVFEFVLHFTSYQLKNVAFKISNHNALLQNTYASCQCCTASLKVEVSRRSPVFMGGSQILQQEDKLNILAADGYSGQRQEDNREQDKKKRNNLQLHCLWLYKKTVSKLFLTPQNIQKFDNCYKKKKFWLFNCLLFIHCNHSI